MCCIGGVFERLGTDKDGSGPQKCKYNCLGVPLETHPR